MSREDGQEKVILPIWHNVTKSFVSRHSPLLSDKLAISSEKGIETVANEILKATKKDLTAKGIFFSGQEISSLIEAVKYFRAREGNFNTSDDPILSIVRKLNNNRNGIDIKRFTSADLSSLLKIINENIEYLNEYKYLGLPVENALDNKQLILMPLFESRRKIKTEIYRKSEEIE